jgi:hypothetical protein
MLELIEKAHGDQAGKNCKRPDAYDRDKPAQNSAGSTIINDPIDCASSRSTDSSSPNVVE